MNEPWAGKRDEDVLWSQKSLEDRIETQINHLEDTIAKFPMGEPNPYDLALTMLNSLKQGRGERDETI